MESKNEISSNSSVDRQNVSFKFTRKISKAAVGNQLEENSSNIQKDYVIQVDENKIKSTAPKNKDKDLTIPLIKKNKWRLPESEQHDDQDPEKRLNDLAVQELLKESRERNEQWEKREFKNDSLTIALFMQNKVPEGYETDEKLDVSLRPDESKLEDYDRIPVEKFGLAVLRGMGWKEGDPIGANSENVVAPVQVNLRPKGLGLGADASALNKAKDKNKNEEKLELIKGAYVHIIQGRHQGFYGEVLGLDEENARVIVKLSNDKTATFPELSVEVVSKKVYEKESKVINRASYEKYKKESEEKEKIKSESKKLSRKDKESSEDRKSSKEERKRSHSNESNSEQREKHFKNRSIDRSIDSGSHRSSKAWVRPQLRVRLIDDKYKKGKYFNEKVVVIDVLSPKHCTCKTENGKYLEDISPSMLETVIPRTEPSYVMIVQGKYTGELCTILERNKSKCLATVQFLSDRDQALELEYDSICEYVGDVSQYD